MIVDDQNTYPGFPWISHAYDYWLDAIQRSVLFLDILRKRGNNYLEHNRKGKPPVLSYDYETIIDGRTFKDRPVNYALVKIIPEKSVKIDPTKRPIVIIDPRAGHGPGIGGFKHDSEIGVSLSKGHPVYLVIFFPKPIRGQTLADVQKAEVKFIEKVASMHPKAEEPSVIGNCQGGWASMLIGADRPDVTGPMVLAGSPLSYWSGGEGVNPMRYRGGLLGGVWMTSLLSDISNGIFDGAHLVWGFEELNPANTYWSKLYNLYSKVDTEEERFLNFERWWSGFYYMTTEEIHFIVDSLFMGNRLEQGKLDLEKDKNIKLENLEDPIVMFTSKGDNITPPQQALNWIAKVYGSVDEIKRQQQVLVYLVHEEVGHLGIFVSSSVAKKEHREIVESLEQVEFLPPGLYEMIIEKDDNLLSENKVRFEEREIDDIRDLEDEYKYEDNFKMVAEISKINDRIYRTIFSPWVKLFTTEFSAEVIKQLHPMRVSRYMFSDQNPFLLPIKAMAPTVKANRKPVLEDNQFLKMERDFSRGITNWLNFYREIRDQNIEFTFKTFFGNPMLKSMIPKTEDIEIDADIEKIEKEKSALLKLEKEHWMGELEKGGFVEGVFRIVQAMARADRSFDRTEFNVVDKIRKNHERFKGIKLNELKRISKEQSRILQTDQEKAINALSKMLTTSDERAEALEIAQNVILADGVMAKEEIILQKKIKKVLKQ